MRVADEEMLRALRVATVERGVDPRGYALVAFGGAGPMHAARLAEQLGVTRVLCPPAVGRALRARARDRRPAPRRGPQRADGGGGGRAQDARRRRCAELAAAARGEMPGARLEAHYDLRYRGQSFELEVTAGAATPSAGELRERFEQAHERRYGYRDPDGPIELVNVRVSATEERPRRRRQRRTGGRRWSGARARRVFDGRELETAVLRGAGGSR